MVYIVFRGLAPIGGILFADSCEAQAVTAQPENTEKPTAPMVINGGLMVINGGLMVINGGADHLHQMSLSKKNCGLKQP